MHTIKKLEAVMPKFIKFVAPPACAVLLAPVCFPEQPEVYYPHFVYVEDDLSAREPYDQPHNHNSENEPLEPTTLAFSMYTNTSAAMVLTSSQPVVWVIQSSESTFDHDQFVAERLKATGITLFVRRPPAEPAAVG
jgi:hypothetical protein